MEKFVTLIPVEDKWSWNLPYRPLEAPGLDHHTSRDGGLVVGLLDGPPPPDRVLAPVVFIYLLARTQAAVNTLALSLGSVPRAQQGRNVPTWNMGGGGAKNTNTLFAPDSASTFSVVQTGAVTRWVKYNPQFILYQNKRVHSHLLILRRHITFFTTPKNSHWSVLHFDWPLHIFVAVLNFPPAGEGRKNSTRRNREEEGTAENKGGGEKKKKWNNRRLVERLSGRVGKARRQRASGERDLPYIFSPCFCVKIFFCLPSAD